jgi:hypothetical protein
MNQVIPFAQEQDVTVIVAAGNDGRALNEVSPQNLGTTENGLMTVGGVEKDGTLFTDTNHDLGLGGSISIYAAAREVLCAARGGGHGSLLLLATRARFELAGGERRKGNEAVLRPQRESPAQQ